MDNGTQITLCAVFGDSKEKLQMHISKMDELR